MNEQDADRARVKGISQSLCVAATMLLCLLSTATNARTIAVPSEYPTIKGALIAARAGDIVLVGCGTYREYDIQLKSGVSLWSGTLQPECVTIDATGQGRCLVFVAADSTTSVVGFTLRGGQAPGDDATARGGAVLATDSSPRFTRCVFVDNSAKFGGALAAAGQGEVRFAQCRFERNHAEVAGGALDVSSSNLDITQCLFQDNTAGNSGGAITLHESSARISASLLSHNAGGLGGGAIAGNLSRLTLRNCTLAANIADGGGTALSGNQFSSTLNRVLLTDSLSPVFALTEAEMKVTRTNILVRDTGGWPVGIQDQRHHDDNLSVDPLYCDPSTRDYHLRPGSPCLGQDAQSTIGALGAGCGSGFPLRVLD